ncbi:MAG TPA: hypothetical protein VH372_10630 [Actinospica sp.]|nr:hypothetical protein [Actinospica sp.]
MTGSQDRWIAVRLRCAAVLVVVGFAAFGVQTAHAATPSPSATAAVAAASTTSGSPSDTGSPWD